MSVSIIACPSCRALVLPDTAQCPNCGHVFDESRATAEAAAPGTVESTEEEVPCPGCNELVRKGLVRCWNCGTFMQQEIADSYRRMQISPPKVIYSDVQEKSGQAVAAPGGLSDSGRLLDEAERDEGSAADEPADEEGFEYDIPDGGESGDGVEFDLGAAEPPSAPNEIVESAPYFKLQEPEPPPAREPKQEAKTSVVPAKSDSRPEFSNEFEQSFGVDDQNISTGEVLLRTALEEEAETGLRRRSRHETGRPGFRVYCPNGHRIEVQERHRGLTGRCPRCREPFVVPANTWDEERAQQEADAQKRAAITAAVNAPPEPSPHQMAEVSAGEYTRWMLDTHFHAVDLTRLKLKPGSLAKDYQEADLGFAPDGLLAVVLVKKGGLLGGGEKKKLANRQAVLDHLSHGKAREDLPAGPHQFFAADTISQLRVVQPVGSAEQSMFAGVPVFGEGSIAVRLPKRDETSPPQFLSFRLSEFRRFSQILEEFFGLRGFGKESGIPLEDVFTERYCHFSDAPMRILEHLEFYRNDPGLPLALIGYKCAGCGLVVSEESREKEKIGGKGGKKIAKAKCPKCQKPFGNLPLYSLATAPVPPA
jgi:hypothetical protein